MTVTTANFQNYKNYFVPSFSLGLDALFNTSTNIAGKAPIQIRNKRDLGAPVVLFQSQLRGKTSNIPGMIFYV